MLQGLPGFSLDIQITPTDLMVDNPNQLVMLDSENRVITEPKLLLRPGEFSQVFLQLNNKGADTLSIRLEFQVEGYFLANWFRILPEQVELGSGERIDASIDFRLPDNFFEESSWLPKTAASALDYQGYLYAWSINGDEVQFLDSKPLKFAVRPRSLYLNFLPEFYSENDFSNRFLSIFEKTFEPTVQKLESIWAYLDPRTAPQGLLPFLAAWVAWPLDNNWDLPQQRHLILNAVEIYRWRGTKRGLRLYLHLYTGLPLDEHLPEAEKHIGIEEVFTEGFVLNSAYIGQDAVLGGGHPFHFFVRLRPDSPDQINLEQIRNLIEREKPAFCTFELYIAS
jgi:phage tail-like protein